MDTIAIIPVRGGSRGIPRKNARLLAGKHLLAYSIKAAVNSNQIDAVFVSTDDDELAEIATRCGVGIIKRPNSLALDDVGLDAVILDAVEQLETTGTQIVRLVTIQATCPLISAHTIDLACAKHIKEDLDTVLTVVDDRHLCWGHNKAGKFYHLYSKRVNRQQLPPKFRETGGVVVCSRKTLNTGSRFGKRVGVVEVDKKESIDIDDYFDWWLAEKSLTRKCICFHVVGNHETGLGHAYRALTIADKLIDHEIWFLVNTESTLAAQLIERRFYHLQIVQNGEEIGAIIDSETHLVVNDILDTDEKFMVELKNRNLSVINFEDLGQGSVHADYLINEMYDAHPTRNDANVLQGGRYSCLRDEFYSIEPITIHKKVNTILVLFGGTDPSGMTSRCLQWLNEIKGDWKVTVIIGIGHNNPKEVQQLAADNLHEVEVITNTTVISRHMAAADIAITSGGRTVFELASLGIPMLVIAQNERETHHIFANSSPGVIYLGLENQLKKNAFNDTLSQLLGSKLLRKKMHDILLASGIHNGINHVTDTIKSLLKQ